MKYSSILIFMVMSLNLSAQSTLTLSLEDCIRYAEENNLTMKTAKLNQLTSDINLTQAKASMLPTVSASASQGLGFNNNSDGASWSGNYALNAGITIFNGFNIQNNIKQNEIYKVQSELQFEENRNNISIQIVQAFLSVLMNQELLVFQDSMLKTSKEQLAQGFKQFKVGSILESDYFLLEAQFSSDSFNVKNTKITIDNNLLSLKNLLSLDPATSVNIVKPDSAALNHTMDMLSLEEVRQKTLAYHPSLKLSDNNMKSAEYDVKLSQSAYFPTLSANAGVSTGYSNGKGAFTTQLDNNLNENLGLNLSIPIYNRRNTKTKVALSKVKMEQAQIECEQQKIELLQKVEQEYLQVLQTMNNYKVSEVKEKAYFASFEAYNHKFNLGSITAVDLLQQQNNYLNVLNEYLQNKYSYILNLKILDVYMGVPIKL